MIKFGTFNPLFYRLQWCLCFLEFIFLLLRQQCTFCCKYALQTLMALFSDNKTQDTRAPMHSATAHTPSFHHCYVCSSTFESDQ
ncbi:hypothetical protein K435DRAFT_162812 [Dendrothele bispora CBS 962.96]|uniref:Uncharacterized protein n=1 Tax=Dendrothele bispora (strain CBS 962.96) TaxID=1314807 RepID=A0A4S8LXZ7_DENBC|nr:hypothetical protein K435DRAFT_162812 [Dendrothele bispora CBS 962.96]